MKALYSRTTLQRRAVDGGAIVNPWLVLRTRTYQEHTVHTDLQHRQINSYLPTRMVRRRTGRSVATRVPLFPGYVFVQPRLEQFESIRYVRGSCGLVLAGTRPATMPESDLEAVKRLVRSGAPLDVNQRLMCGLRVEVIDGPLTGVAGELVDVKRRSRLVINAPLMCRSVSVEIDARKIWILG
jgi:transcription antitermination factor NusG